MRCAQSVLLQIPQQSVRVTVVIVVVIVIAVASTYPWTFGLSSPDGSDVQCSFEISTTARPFGATREGYGWGSRDRSTRHSRGGRVQ